MWIPPRVPKLLKSNEFNVFKNSTIIGPILNYGPKIVMCNPQILSIYIILVLFTTIGGGLLLLSTHLHASVVTTLEVVINNYFVSWQLTISVVCMQCSYI